MRVCQFVVPGEPVGKGRPRFDTRGKYARAYTPKKTRDYETLVRMCWKLQSGKSFGEGVALVADIKAFFPIPKSLSAKKRAELRGKPHIKKPDADNVEKAVLDALNSCAFPDDSAVADARTVKRYDDNPRVEVYITEWENEC